MFSQVIAMFGGTVNAETFRHSKEYFFYISLGIPFYMFGQAANPVIRADGSPKFAMISTLAGAVINIILDPIFIFIFKWGMMGAAVATVFGQVVTAILAVWYFMHTKIVRLSTSTFRLKSDIVRHSLTLGICSFLSQISLVASMAAINNMIRQYGAMDAGSKSRVSELFTKLLVGEAIVGAIALLIVELLPRQLIAIFGAANESVYYTDFAIKAFRIYLCMIVFACVNKATFIFLQAMGKAAASTALSMIREIVFGVGFALLLPIYFGLDGVLYSMPVSDILTAIVSAVIIVLTYRELRHSAS
ncbi:polysaccharide biosynthesis C-terminal domain-containing protein [Bacteroides caecimuris]|uniref:MATE family efflux transporter n=1 Tax=Bacteroides caecimuris TaxID=1796613 RepID=UPI00336BE8A1